MRKLTTLATILLSLAVAIAQENKSNGPAQSDKARNEAPKPDFSGTWLRDNSKSSGLQGPLASAELTMVITHHDPEFKISRSIRFNDQLRTQELAYYTDRRGETNPATFGRGDLKSKTKWDKTRIETRASWSTMSQSGEPGNYDSTEKWELALDGKTLTDTVEISSGRGVRTLKQVFTRAS